MKKALLCCFMALAWNSALQAQCMDTTIDQSTVCNLIPNSGFENGLCDPSTDTIGYQSFYTAGFPNYSMVSDWMVYNLGGYWPASNTPTPDLFARNSVDLAHDIPITSTGPPWMIPYNVELYASVSLLTGVDNDRCIGMIADKASSSYTEPVVVKLKEPLFPGYTYNLSFWIFNTCTNFYGSGSTDRYISLFFTDSPTSSSGHTRYYPENASLQTEPNITRIATAVACVDSGDTANGKNGWSQMQFFNIQIPLNSPPLEWFVLGDRQNEFANNGSYYLIDDVLIEPAEPITGNVGIEGSTAQCANDTYELIDYNPNIVYTWYATNASNSTQVGGTTYTPNWTTNTGGEVHVIASNNTVTHCTYNGDTLASLIINPCCDSDTADIQLTSQTASYVINNILSSGNTWTTSSNILINGTFTVDTNFSFLNCPNILLAKNARIEIDTGKTLTIDGSTLRACGNNMWYGIIIPDYSAELVLNNCSVMEAQVAVASTLGGKFDIDSTLFEGNNVSVNMYNRTATDTFYAPHTSSWSITNSTFRYPLSTGLLPPYQGQYPVCGIWISDFWDGVANSSSLPIHSNYFDLSYAVQAITTVRSSLEIYDNTFYRTAGIKSNGMNINNTPNPDYLPNVSVISNTFDDARDGINAYYSQYLYVYDNTLLDTYISGEYFDHSGAYFGVYNNALTFSALDVFAAITMLENTAVEIDISANTLELNEMSIGICVGTANLAYPNECSALIDHNVIFNPEDAGIISYGYSAFDEILSGGTHGLNVIDNYIELPVASEAICSAIDVYDNALIKDNVINFDDNYEDLSTGIRIQGNDFMVECNEVYDGDIGMYITSGIDNFESYSNAWRGPKTGAWWLKNSFVGDVGNTGQPSMNQWTPSVNSANPNTNYTFPYVISDNSNGNLSHFYFLPLEPGSLNWLVPSNEININGGSAPKTTALLGDEYPCTEEKTGHEYLKTVDAKRIQPRDGANLAKGARTLDNSFERRRTAEQLYVKLSKKYGPIENEEVAAIYNTLHNQPFGKLINVFSKIEGSISDRETLFNLLASVEAVRHEDMLLKTVAEIAIRKQYASDRSLSKDDVKTLREIAKLCPITDGLAVYQARHFLGIHWKQTELNPCEIPDQQSLQKARSLARIQQAKKLQEGIVVFPNPSSGIVYIEGLKEAIDEVEVIDLSGRLIVNFEEVDPVKGIDLSTLQDNVYTLRIKTSKQTLYKKIVLTKE